MVERVFEWMFVLALVAPPVTVAIGWLLLFIGPHRARSVSHAPRTVGA